MRLPRHATTVSLSAEPPLEALARDEALLDAVTPGGPRLQRWYVVDAPAVVLGLGLWHRVDDVVDVQRCRELGVEVLERRAGGGAVLLDEGMLCAAVCVPLPDARVGVDLTESYGWLGEQLASGLRECGVRRARRVEVAEARTDVMRLKAGDDPLLRTCFGALSPHEVVADGGRKLVGLAQVRRRHAALFQIGILLRDQSPLADLLRMPDEKAREHLRASLRQRTVGLADIYERVVEPRTIMAVLADRLAG